MPDVIDYAPPPPAPRPRPALGIVAVAMGLGAFPVFCAVPFTAGLLDRLGPRALFWPLIACAIAVAAMLRREPLRCALVAVVFNCLAAALWFLAGGWAYFAAGP